MKIIELESKTGLDRATIRYYEKEGLITPNRQENGYRDYSAEDMNHLLKIKLLRQLGMSMDRIRNLQQGSEDFSTALSDQLRQLDDKIAAAQQAKSVCQDMLNDRVNYATLNTEIYFAKLSAKPAVNTPTISKAYHEPAAVEPYHPVRRYVARAIDYFLIESILLIVLIVIFRVRPISDFTSNLIAYGSPFLAIPLAAFFLHRFGTTPGKWLMGLGVSNSNGGRLSYSDGLSREWDALRYGYGFGIPIWSLIRLYKSYRQHGDRKSMDWDYHCEYLYHPWDRRRKIALSLSIILMISINSLSFLDLLKPTYRGDLTVAEFASNYNDYVQSYLEDASASQYLQQDGTWPEQNSSSNTNGVVIVIGSKSENNDFTYELEGERITAIRYQNTWTDIMACNPLGGKLQIAVLTMLMSQPNATIFDLYELEDLWESNFDQENGSFTCKNIQVSWNIQSVNCFKSTGNTYYSSNQDVESSVTVDFELIVH